MVDVLADEMHRTIAKRKLSAAHVIATGGTVRLTVAFGLGMEICWSALTLVNTVASPVTHSAVTVSATDAVFKPKCAI